MAGKKENLLIVEDQSKKRQKLSGMFEGDFELLEAKSQEEALELILRQKKEITVVMSGENYIEMIQHMKEEKKMLRIEANTDPLTKLYNRRAFERNLETIFSVDAEECGAFLMVDLDNFKMVNDKYGHRYGDMILKDIADKIVSHIREHDLAGRIGGDEFVIFLRGFSALEKIREKAENIGSILRMDCKEVRLSGSIGVSRYPQDGKNYDELLQKADYALYEAKRRGKNGWIVYGESLE